MKIKKAIAEHVKYGEKKEIGKNVIIVLLAAIVSVGRLIPAQ